MAHLGGLQSGAEGEFARHHARRHLNVEGAFHAEEPPPAIADAFADWISAWLSSDRFLSYFESIAPADSAERVGAVLEVTVFACFYPASVRLEYAGSSVVCTRRRRGFVFVPVEETTRGYYLARLAHELCHTIGATDKYRGDRSVFPEGYAAPERLPLFPQTHSEIMSLSTPQVGLYRLAERLRHWGATTAEEIGWVELPRLR